VNHKEFPLDSSVVDCQTPICSPAGKLHAWSFYHPGSD
jgi:hypothetical protein